MNRQMTYVIACLAAMAQLSPVAAEDHASRPNIVLILADDKYAEAG